MGCLKLLLGVPVVWNIHSLPSYFSVLNQKHTNMTVDNAEDQKSPCQWFRYAGGNQLLLEDRHEAPHTYTNPSMMGSKSLKPPGEKKKPLF